MPATRFGLNVSTSVITEPDPVRTARRAEELGFDFLSASDHPAGTHPTYETWTLLSWVAAATSRIDIATRVLGVPYRSPAMVAKMAETLDRLSGGRLILGLGGGSSDEETRAYGMGVRSPRDKVDGLAEAVQIIRGLWSQPRLTFRGRLYTTDEAPLEPKPTRRIPIWLGTFGPRALAVTGELADGWIPSLGHVGAERLADLRQRVVTAARSAGRHPAEVTYACNLTIRVEPGRAGPPADISGSADAVTKQLAELIDLGFTAVNLMPVGPDVDAQTERLATEVIPRLRDGA